MNTPYKTEISDVRWIAYDIRKTVADRWRYFAKSCGLSRGQIETMAPAFTGDSYTYHRERSCLRNDTGDGTGGSLEEA